MKVIDLAQLVLTAILIAYFAVDTVRHRRAMKRLDEERKESNEMLQQYLDELREKKEPWQE